jgi:hypothetical protein
VNSNLHLRGDQYLSYIFVVYYLSSEFAFGSLRDGVASFRPSPFTFFLGGGGVNMISEPNLDIFGTTAKKKDIENEN